MSLPFDFQKSDSYIKLLTLKSEMLYFLLPSPTVSGQRKHLTFAVFTGIGDVRYRENTQV